MGAFSGKETLGLLIWLASWGALHVLLRKRELDERRWGVLFLAGMGISSILIRPPTIHLLLGR